MSKKIVIIGAGPTGLGAGYRLKEQGYEDFIILERNSYVGGLAASFKKKDFTVDIGGHVLFSHYPYFDKVVEDSLQGKYLEHQREAWVWIKNKFVPYPFQNNIKYLPPDMIWECVLGLLELGKSAESQNFDEWIDQTFGAGIAKYFMKPYNFKVWAHPLNMMSKDWIAERVSVIDINRVLKNIIFNQDDVAWGPNNMFKFPLFGGTGAIFTGIAENFKKYIRLNSKVERIESQNKTLFLGDGTQMSYDLLINTMPLDILIKNSDLQNQYAKTAELLLHNGIFSVSLGFNRPLEEDKKTKCWNYFPETDSPFYRVTYLSNYSPNMVPDIKKHFLLMCETSYSDYKKHNKETILNDTIKGLVQSKFIDEKDQDLIFFDDVIEMEYEYPIPSCSRDKALNELIPALEKKDIYSRGRFGQWRYETGNMDHSFMQGVEVVDLITSGKKEETRFKR
ncbi:MAG: FAD-dependent oxidoreductase [Candidatus Margulisbacteria bacterium]|nr:FAD-dependent oxidoreductase [Candidatus Margulisiibacteriota bacterium]